MCKQGDTTTIYIRGREREDGRVGWMNGAGDWHDGPLPVGVDSCIAGIVMALNAAGARTIASCCGHGHRPGRIALADGREILLARDEAEAQAIDAFFPLNIQGEPVDPQPEHVPRAGGCDHDCPSCHPQPEHDAEVEAMAQRVLDELHPIEGLTGLPRDVRLAVRADAIHDIRRAVQDGRELGRKDKLGCDCRAAEGLPGPNCSVHGVEATQRIAEPLLTRIEFEGRRTDEQIGKLERIVAEQARRIEELKASVEAFREAGKARRVELVRMKRSLADAKAEGARESLLLDQPWPLPDVVAKLVDAARHLLKDHACDRHGYEAVTAAADAGEAWLRERGVW
jgi:hypothetical protein